MLAKLLNKESKSTVLKIGHTPDPDDAYMFYGFATNQVSVKGFEIEHVLEDIQSLNQKAMEGKIGVSAISAAIYPLVHNSYWILPVGASVGRNYGPVVVRRADDTNPKTRRIAIPGRHTTAALLLKLYGGLPYEPVEYRFDQIPEALKKGDVDFGLLIHEAQITYKDYGFEKVMDLGVEWMRDTQLPIPLGLDVVHKNLGRDTALRILEALKRSIEIANEQKDEAIQYALKYGRGLQKSLGETFVGMYVNDDTLDLGPEGEKALNLLFDKAYRAGIFARPTPVEILRP